MPDCDVLVVGAGLSGATMARLCAEQGKKVWVIDQRPHVAGNCYDYIHKESGLLIPQYGAHIFHTDDSEVMDFLKRFAKWRPYYHKVVAEIVPYRYVPMPVNMTTLNHIFPGANLREETETLAFLESIQKQPAGKAPANAREMAEARVGEQLTALLYDGYTRKQWDCRLEELEPEVTARLRVEPTADDRYFKDRFQCLPIEGYTKLVKNMLKHDNICVRLNTPYDKTAFTVGDFTYFTGPIDAYFDTCGLPKLEYRSIQFHVMHVKDDLSYPAAVVNFPGINTPFTRVVQPKLMFPPQAGHDAQGKGNVLIFERSTANGEPYPVPKKANRELYAKYQELAEQVRGVDKVEFGGRLGSYKYYNMDQAVRAAINDFERCKGVYFTEQ